MKKIIALSVKNLALGAAFLPAFASAQISGGVGDTVSLVGWLISAFNIASGLILAAAVVFFLWGVFQYVKAGGNDDAQAEGRAHIINGIIGIAVMVSVWGLVNFFTRSAGLSNTVQQAPALPTIVG